jgi:hypothetical protein
MEKYTKVLEGKQPSVHNMNKTSTNLKFKQVQGARKQIPSPKPVPQIEEVEQPEIIKPKMQGAKLVIKSTGKQSHIMKKTNPVVHRETSNVSEVISHKSETTETIGSQNSLAPLSKEVETTEQHNNNEVENKENDVITVLEENNTNVLSEHETD